MSYCDDSNGGIEAAYDLNDFRLHCGIGLQQIAPYQLKSELDWGGESVRQYGLFGQIFVRNEVYANCFEPFGVHGRAVLGPDWSPPESIVQLTVDENVDVVADDHLTAVCGVRSVSLRALVSFSNEVRAARGVVRRAQWFGGGSIAQQLVLVSQPVAAVLTEHNVRGAVLHPVASA